MFSVPGCDLFGAQHSAAFPQRVFTPYLRNLSSQFRNQTLLLVSPLPTEIFLWGKYRTSMRKICSAGRVTKEWEIMHSFGFKAQPWALFMASGFSSARFRGKKKIYNFLGIHNKRSIFLLTLGDYSDNLCRAQYFHTVYPSLSKCKRLRLYHKEMQTLGGLFLKFLNTF